VAYVVGVEGIAVVRVLEPAFVLCGQAAPPCSAILSAKKGSHAYMQACDTLGQEVSLACLRGGHSGQTDAELDHEEQAHKDNVLDTSTAGVSGGDGWIRYQELGED